jgi:putative cell wall-binding protein
MTKTFKALITGSVASLIAVGSVALLTNDARAEDLTRIGGSNRYETAELIARKAFEPMVCIPQPCGTRATAAVLVSGETFADAIAAAPLARAANGPLLLMRKTQIPAETWRELQRNFPNKNGTIYVLGGEAVINKAQTDFLTAQGFKVIRLAGRDRMDTAAKAAITSDGLRGKKPTQVYLVNGFDFADGLSIGPLASYQQRNILVTENGDLSQVVRDYVNGNIDTLSDVILIGGTKAIPDAVAKLFTDNGFIVSRIAGSDRYATAVEIAKKFTAADKIGLASGSSFPDGLTAGYYLSQGPTPLLLDQNVDCGATHKHMIAKSSIYKGGFIFGGTNAVSSVAEWEAERAIDGTKICS